MKLDTRFHKSEDGTESSAIYSACGTYRYSLTRSWNTEAKKLLYVMLNPSKATELANDPTIERCERRARALGYGAFRACNIFAIRETDPSTMKKALHPEGPSNAQSLKEGADWADDILCAWGVHGEHLDQNQAILELLAKSAKPLLALGVTKAGHPRHPLYIGYAEKPKPYRINI